MGWNLTINICVSDQYQNKEKTDKQGGKDENMIIDDENEDIDRNGFSVEIDFSLSSNPSISDSVTININNLNATVKPLAWGTIDQESRTILVVY